MNKNKIIIFDFDGVIVNSCQLSFELNRESFSDITYTDIQEWAEGNVYTRKLREDYDDSFVELYFERYSQQIKTLIPVEGIESVLEKFISDGYKLVIVSSSDEESIDGFLEKYNLTKYFDGVMGRKTSSSKVKKFKLIFKKYKIKSNETVMITDSIGDVKEAMEVKIKTIGVSWGIHEAKRLKETGADFIAETPKDIVVGVKKILVLN
jgi:phosphoglycolate phosphatase